MQKQENSKGFTLIEVVLVLAIAGLIFLIVFLALPALQRSQRDTQRKNDLSRLMSQVTTFQSNNQGQLPGSSDWNSSFKSSYLTSGGQQFNDPETGSYTITQAAGVSTAPNPAKGNITVYVNARCDSTPDNGVTGGDGVRQIAVVIPVEQGGFYCQNN